MKRKITFLIAALFALTLITQSFTAMGQAKTDPTYKLTAVTSVSAGNKYVLVRNGYALSNTVTSNALQTTSSYSTTALVGTESYVWTLESATDGLYMKNASLASNQYLNSVSSKTNVAFGSQADLGIWSFTFSNSLCTIKAVNNSNRFLGDAGKNTPNNTYRAYANTNSNLSDYLHEFTVYILEEESDEPSITVAPSSLNGLSYNHGNGPSTAKSFTVSGTNLTANINITAPTHYAICTTQNGSYSGSITLTQTAGTVSNITIYARLKEGQDVGDYNSENVTLTSTGATQKTVSLSGTVSGYTVTYDCNDGTSNCPDDESNVPSGNYTINSTEPSRTNYSFGGWNDGTTTYDAGDEYTISGNVTFTAEWVPDTYAYAINITGPDTGATATLSVGGETLDENDEIDYNAEVTINVNVSSGYGYSIEVIDSDDNEVELDDDNKFTMPASEVYITITTVVDPYSKVKLTSSNMLSMTGDVAYDTEKTVTVNGYTWKTTGYQGTSNQNRMGMIQLRTKNTPYIQLPQLDGKIKEITFKVTGAGNSDSSYENGTATTTGLVFKTSTGGSSIASSESTSSKSRTITMPTGFYNTGYILSDGGIRVWEISITYLPYDNFTDLDPSDPMPATLSAGANVAVPSDMETTNLTIPATAALVVKSGATLTLSGTLTNQGTAANLVIEEGGQLKLADDNTTVKATVKKSVTKWTGSLAEKTDPVNDGWQTISTSTHDNGKGYVSFSNVDNLVYLDNTTPRYNVYAYDEANILWVNNLASAPYGFSTLNVGQGYIYRTGGSIDLAYKGYVNTGDIDVDLSYNCGTASFKGFNLIGNPYTHSIYKGGEGSAIDNGTLLEAKYYALNLTTGMFTLTNDGTEIPRGTAIMVQAKSSGTLTMKNSSVYVAPAAKAGNDNIWFSVKNENFQDFACVDFKPGRGLNKIDHQNENAPMLYINHNGENFGSVNMSDDTKSINLNFKAMTMGKYTLSLKPEGNFSYIHVIDKLTGEDIDMLLEGEYSFIASPSDADNRFIVKLGYQPDYGNDSDIFAYQSGSEIYVTGNGELQIFDVTGRRVMTTTINGSESISIPNQGVYIFRLNEKVQKIVVR